MKFFSFVFIMLSCFLLLQTQHFASVVAGEPPRQGHVLAPALYVFGDSLVDSGNNNYLKILVKVNYTPYGIDFRNGATGRFTNGKTVVDFIANWLGLPYAPPYLGLSEKQKRKVSTGINYASGAAGILPESGTATGDNLSLEEQVNYFTKTAKNDLPKIFKSHKKISKYFSKSIFVISIGSNDYINNYLQPENYNSSKTYTPQQYADLLVSTLRKHLTSIYKLGARKFLVFELGPIGCLPGIVFSVTPKPTTPCVEDINSMVKIFNSGVTNMIQELTSTLKGSTFVRGDIFERTYQQEINPRKHGFSGGNTPCCSISKPSSLCLPNYQTLCKNRKDYLHWDGFHPTQRVNYETANGCFKGSSTCFPMNVHQLARK